MKNIKKIFYLFVCLIPVFCSSKEKEIKPPVQKQPHLEEKATFAAGCFWCIQPAFDKADGVIETHVGFSGGNIKNPTYEQVSTGGTGQAEAIQVSYDPQKISYQQLLDIF